jgi:hypothetical protein
MLSEQPLHLAHGKMGSASDLRDVERLIQCSLHERDRLDELRVIDAVTRVQVEPLMILVCTDLGVNELLSHAQRELRAGHLLHEMQHHVQGRGAAGASQHIVIDDI